MSLVNFGFKREIVLKYTRGDCDKLSEFLQKRIGGDIYGIVLTSAYDEFVLEDPHWHFCVGTGKYFVDIEGIWKSKELISKYKKYIISQQYDYDANDYRLALINGEDVSNWKIVGEDDEEEEEDNDEEEEDENDFQLFLIKIKNLSCTLPKPSQDDKKELREIVDTISEKISGFNFYK